MTQLTINLLDPIGTINPNIYGHFAEHLGRCIYDGIWVGEDSAIPNTDGFRDDVIAALRRLKPPVIRWPGGCFADDYHWQDGIGPASQRPRRINIHWGEVIDTNAVGTQEFVRFCRLVGAEPYICGNVGSGTVRELRDWVEYCNFAGDSSWAQQRAADGSPAPLDVTYWGVGNENWGCGGHFSPEDYCAEFRRYASFVRGFGKSLFVIACGPPSNDIEWTTRFFRKLRKDYWDFRNIHGFAAHYYCGTAGTATEYTVDQWYQLIARVGDGAAGRPAAGGDGRLRSAAPHRPDRGRVGHVASGRAGHQPALPLSAEHAARRGSVAATTLDIFNRHADKVVMANIAQTVNVLQAMILTEGDKMLVTPTGHVYEMYAPHQAGQAVRVLVDTESITWQQGEKQGALPVIAGSASLKEKTLFVTLTNSHATEAVEVGVQPAGRRDGRSLPGAAS